MSKRGIQPWHSRVINALLAIGLEYGFESSTGIVYYKIGRNRFEYHPDVLWLCNNDNRFKPNAYVWEIESRWGDLKRITGDSTLAFMMRPEYTTFFKRKEDTKFGRILKKDEKVLNYYGATRATYHKNYHKKMNLNASCFMLVVEHQGNEEY
ncbi:MAG: hypothetical protein ABSF65_02280 [Candidatus Bathyarchaeia archaeon]|jgi:hypothetical protein